MHITAGKRDQIFEQMGGGSTMAAGRRFDAVAFDLLTALIDSWTLWTAPPARPRTDCDGGANTLSSRTPPAGIAPTRRSCAKPQSPPAWMAAAADRLIACGQSCHYGLSRCASSTGLRAGSRSASPPTARRCSACAPSTGRVGTSRRSSPPKPPASTSRRPEPYQAVLRLLGTDAGRTLFVAGSAADVPGAKAVGMPVFWHNRMHLQPLESAEAGLRGGVARAAPRYRPLAVGWGK